MLSVNNFIITGSLYRGVPSSYLPGHVDIAFSNTKGNIIEWVSKPRFWMKLLHRGKEIHDLEVDYRLNEKNVTLSVTTKLLHGNGGEAESAVAVIKDLTEKKAFEDQLRRQDKLTAMGELPSGVVHEIRNPLNATSISSQCFANEFRPVEKEVEYQDLANSVVLATRQVNSIIERFLNTRFLNTYSKAKNMMPEPYRK